MSERIATLGREGVRSLGAQFTAVRETRGLSLEQVAIETRIRVVRLREMERDDYSQFSHPTYAHMYAIRYAKYLGIPVSLVRRVLPEPKKSGTTGYQYLEEIPCAYMRTDLGSGHERRHLMPKVIAAAFLVLIGLGGFKFWMTLRDIERLGLNRMAGGEKPVFVVTDNILAVPRASVTPKSPSDSIEAKHKRTEGSEAEAPVRHTLTVDGEAATLVGASVWPDSAGSE